MYRVVLVDDEQFILNGLINVFPWGDYDCQIIGTAGDGQQGLELVRREQPDILLTDIQMPGIDGLKMAAALKSEYPAMQIAVLTAFRDFDYARRALHIGVSRYLLKPSNMEDLHEAFAFMTLQKNAEQETAPGDTAAVCDEAGGFVLNAAIRYIEENYADKLTLSQVADSVYISQWHLSKLINGRLNKTFYDVINDIRVERAKTLLTDPAMSVSEIAIMVGYCDVSHFSHVFKRLMHVTPAAYRATLRTQK
ncbi:MAG: response regulator [Eubacteriales bacterium]|jgi:YesN/AraC family two-component response regulator|nr:response regulator [Eubacteriales bacterium]MDD4105865.1 response regulator [Eubacteriales bacterium]MDD4711144.1 response regulator [Eubacteriales bacterium]NLO16248.1 response regulator [Clostridiales bacterium]